MNKLNIRKDIKRRQMGLLIINGKQHPIYEGLNIVGRDLKATVILKDVKFSKQHAIISVVDENIHFISDFGSSNGTRVRDITLVPYKFYDLNDNEAVTISDVLGTYHKMTNQRTQHSQIHKENPCKINSESQFSQHDAPTQILHSSSTSAIHELPTQELIPSNSKKPLKFSETSSKQSQSQFDMHEAPTQELFHKTPATSAEPACDSVHDEPTQPAIVPKETENKTTTVSKLVNQTEDETTFSGTELYDDVFANETFRLSLSKNSSVVYNAEVDETVLNENSLIENDKTNDLNNSVDILNTKPINQVDKVDSSQDSVVSTTKHIPSTDSVDDDIIQSTQPDNVENKQVILNDNHGDDDSDTDIEDNDKIRQMIAETSERKTVNDSDSDTDIEDHPDLEKINNSALCGDSNKLKRTEQPAAVDSDSETDVEEDLLTNLPPVVPKDSHQESVNAEVTINDNNVEENHDCNMSDDDDFDLMAPTQKLIENAELETSLRNNELNKTNVETPKKVQSFSETSSSKEQDLGIDEAPTQILNVRPTESNDDDFLAPTQVLHLPKKSSVSQEVPEEADTEDVDFLAPTQPLNIPQQSPNKHKEVNEHDDCDFLAPTQPLNLPSNLNKSIEEQNDEDAYLSATQPLHPADPNSNCNDNDDNAFLAPTQQLSTSVTSNKENDDVDFLAPTQRLSTNSSKSPEKKQKTVQFSEDIFSASTEELCSVNKSNETHSIPEDDNDDVFMAPTQALCSNDDGKQETCDANSTYTDEPQNLSIDESTENLSMKLVLNDTNDDEFLAPTQKLDLPATVTQLNSDSNTNKTITSDSNKFVPAPPSAESKPKPQEPETQLEVDFALETQRLYIEEKTSRPNNPLANMFSDEETQMTETQETQNTDLEIINIAKSVNMETQNDANSDTKTEECNKTLEKSESKLNAIEISTRCSNGWMKKSYGDLEEQAATTSELISENKLKKENSDKQQKNQDTNEEKSTTVKRVAKVAEKKNKGAKCKLDEENDVTDDELPTKENVNKSVGQGKRVNRRSVTFSEETIPDKKETRNKRLRQKENVSNLEENPRTGPETEVKRSARIERRKQDGIVPKWNLKLMADSQQPEESISDDDFCPSKSRSSRASKRTNSTRGKKKSIGKEELPPIDEDSNDSSLERSKKKKAQKIEETDESEPVCSNPSNDSSVPSTRKNKRSLKIEDYSSDENTTTTDTVNTASVCLNTPNSKRRKYEPLNITAINHSQSTNANAIFHQVVFTMITEVDELENSVKALGGTTIDSVYSCTALVTNKISRSLKFLVAVSLGKPIVHVNWIKRSMQENKFLDPWDFLLDDPESEMKFNFSLRESLQKSRHAKLLSDYTIVLSASKNFDVLKEIIEASGAKCTKRAPAKRAKSSLKLVVVGYEEERRKYLNYLKQKSDCIVVSAEAIFSSVLQQNINFNDHLLS